MIARWHDESAISQAEQEEWSREKQRLEASVIDRQRLCNDANVTCCGEPFQTRAAATGKARSPTDNSRVHCAWSGVEDWRKQLTDWWLLCYRPAVEWNEMERFSIPQLSAKPGSPCFNFRGFCDVFHKCREVTTHYLVTPDVTVWLLCLYS